MIIRIPVAFEKARMKQLEPGLRKELKRLAANGSSVVLEGPNGTGKSHAACAFARYLVKKEFAHGIPAYVPAANVPHVWSEFDELRDQPVKTSLRDSKVLILDDMGTENRSSAARTHSAVSELAALLRYRVQANLATIVTTNLNGGEEVKEVFGKSLYSLLRGYSGWLEVTGPDRRG